MLYIYKIYNIIDLLYSYFRLETIYYMSKKKHKFSIIHRINVWDKPFKKVENHMIIY